LNPDQNFLELDDLANYYINEKEIVVVWKEELELDKVLNLDAFIILRRYIKLKYRK
jgi:hypothetical protein